MVKKKGKRERKQQHLLEHSHEVVSSSVYFVKLVLDVRRSNYFILEGRKVHKPSDVGIM